jgi:PEP-CTERM motif
LRSHRLYYIGALACSFFAVTGTAGTVSVGFEAPSYSTGDINGQQGWSKTGNYDAQVSSGASYQGSQSLRISNGITSGSFGDQTFTPQLAVPAGESTVPGAVDTFLSSWYFKSVTGTLQDGLGISVSADNGQGARMTYVRMGDDADNGLNLQFYDTDPTGNFVFQQLATNLDRSVWHRVDMDITFVDGPHNDIVQVFLDGQLLVTGTTWEDFERFGPSSDGGGGLSPVNSLLFRAGGTAAPGTLGNGFYIDDVILTSEASSDSAPEPATWSLFAGGLGMCLFARRRRS